MTLYADTSAVLKRYVDEPDSGSAVELLGSDATLVTARHTVVEVRRNLARLLTGTALTESRKAFAADLDASPSSSSMRPRASWRPPSPSRPALAPWMRCTSALLDAWARPPPS